MSDRPVNSMVINSMVIDNINKFTRERFSDLSNQISKVQNNLQHQIDDVHTQLDTKVNAVYSSLSSAIQAMNDELTEFIGVQKRANRLNQAETRVVKIRQEIEKKFGHYDIVRRTTQGILQADDLELVKKSTIHNTTEELFLTTPNYWLAPCLVALAAWINDDQELAKKAVREAIRRDDEKTCLFFAILCRRANRMPASLKWVRRYLAQQDESHLNRHAIVILDGLVCGLWGIDSENVISAQLDEWLDKLEAKPNFTENQISAWKNVINAWIDPVEKNEFKTIAKYSSSWNGVKSSLEHARIHQKMLNHFQGIYNRKEIVGDTIQILDDCLNNLVTNFDDEEIPLRKEEMLENLIIQYKGDEKTAESKMEVEKKVFDDEKDYMQLLLDAAFNPDTTHASAATCKFAVAVCKNYIVDAHNDITSEYRTQTPKVIVVTLPPQKVTPEGLQTSFTFPEFKSKTQDGSDEEAMVVSLSEAIDKATQTAIDSDMTALKQQRTILIVVTSILGAICLLVGLLNAVTIEGIITAFIFALLFFAAIPLINYFIKQKTAAHTYVIKAAFNQVREQDTQVIHTFCAEVVDFRTSYASSDTNAIKVTDYIDALVPNEYIHVNCERRRIRNHG